MKKRIFKILAVILWIAIWEVTAQLVDQSLYLPGPYLTIKTLIKLLGNKGFVLVTLSSVLRILGGFIISSIIGIVLGIVAGINNKFEIIINPLMTVIKSTPVVSFILIAMIWFSFNTVPLYISFLMCLPVMYNNVLEGIRNIDKRLLDMAQIYRVKKYDVLKGIYINSIKPYIFAAMNICSGLAFKVTIAAEVIANPKFGIGSKMYDAKVYLETQDVFAWTFVIIVLSYLFEKTIKTMYRRGTKWQ